MAEEYLNKTGLTYFWGKIKAYVSSVLPTKTSDLDNDSGFVASSDLATVATSGSYTDLSNKPTIPDDTKMTQTAATASGYTYWRPLVIGMTSGSAESFSPSTTTSTSYTFSTLKVQPSTGTIRFGKASLYSGSYTTSLSPETLTANRTVTIPNKSGTMAMTSDIPSIPTIPDETESATTGISIAAHGTTSVGSASDWDAGSASTWAFEEKTIPNVTSAGSASTWAFEEKTIPNVTSAGSASTWAFEEKTIPNVTSAGSASTWAFEEKTIPNVTAAGSGSASLTFEMDTTDTKKLKISFSHTHTAPTLGTAIKVQSKSSGGNGTAPTLGTAIKVQSKSSGGNGTAPTLGTAIKVQSKSSGGNGTAPTLGTAIKVQSKKSGANSTAPSLTVTPTTVVTGTTHTVTDNGHTHTI